ncbi:MAG: SDR family oxidoreductase [Albidovulum sp.]|nr:SDR family oxidoreductase [Albidovulum sp.]
MASLPAGETQVPVPPLAGTLPPLCSRDLEELKRSIRSFAAAKNVEDAVDADKFREVFVTGANGFAGRFLLGDLLRRTDIATIHCLVRAANPQQGLERVRDAMVESEIWEEPFAQRLRVVAGEICQERFGISDNEFDNLCLRIDAVYHLAASVHLAQPYAEIRKPNVYGLRPVLELCLRTRLKHLFFASTMAVFPSYLCAFSREYQDFRIEDHQQPCLDDVRGTMPLSLIGYTWSKLVAEQAVLFAKTAGVPAAIFRLPYMGLASTGYTQSENLPSKIFAAAAQLELMLRGFSLQRNPEPVDTVAEIISAISRNPDRRFTIYHCCDPEPPFDEVEPADFGFFWQSVSYALFRRACLSMGERSPLHGQWVIVDHFAPYWFDEVQENRGQPICDRAIREDCPSQISWPAHLIKRVRSYGWIRRHLKTWPYKFPKGRLEYEGLVDQAGRLASRMGVPFETTYPPWMLIALRKLVDALNLPEAGLRESRIPHVVYGLNRSLRINAALVKERQEHPEIEKETINRPVFIVGINRTGTTFLHRLLSRDPKFWTLRRYETAEPVLASGEYATALANTLNDPRRVYSEELVQATRIAESLAGLHRIDLDEPEEDFMPLLLGFKTWVLPVAHHVPEYARWLAECGSCDAYSHHRSVMKHFNWQRTQRDANQQRFWLLKMPFHLRELGALLQVYPDALFLQTHRDPVEVMGSWNSMVDRVRSMTTEQRPPLETGAEQLELMSGMLNGAMDFRKSRPSLDRRWLDVRYTDLVNDPMSVVKAIYSRFRWPLEPATVDAMENWLETQAEQRRKEPTHEYRLENHGLTPSMVNEAFSSYLNFADKRGILQK